MSEGRTDVIGLSKDPVLGFPDLYDELAVVVAPHDEVRDQLEPEPLAIQHVRCERVDKDRVPLQEVLTVLLGQVLRDQRLPLTRSRPGVRKT